MMIAQASSFFLALFATVAAAPQSEPAPFDIEAVKDIAYVDGKDADSERHRLDLYLPKSRVGYSVLIWAHGGGWKNGKKEEFEVVGRSLARGGVGMVSINYRLYPKVRFPDNVKDVARAVAWVRRNIGKHGGRADRLFIGGHSAGGHLMS